MSSPYHSSCELRKNLIRFWKIHPPSTNSCSVCGRMISHVCDSVFNSETNYVLNSINNMISYCICNYRESYLYNSNNQVTCVEFLPHQPDHDTFFFGKSRRSIKNAYNIYLWVFQCSLQLISVYKMEGLHIHSWEIIDVCQL